MVRAVRDGELDLISVPDQPLDVLAQQVVAEAAADEEWDEDALLGLFRQAYPYRKLGKAQFMEVVDMLARGYATRRGRRAAPIHYDSLNHKIRTRKGSRMAAIINGGAIPEVFDYRVQLEPEGHFIGTLNEDFAIESLPGDVFQLGNASWRILRIGNGVVRVADAHGQPPSMPFWLGEAPARSDEMSAAVSRLRAAVDAELPGPEAPRSAGELEPATRLLGEATTCRAAAGRPPVTWPRPSAALGEDSTGDAIALERTFSTNPAACSSCSHGSATGQSRLRTRYARVLPGFNFELQAAATERA
jgi:ATP-dependent Lhr-like helicase